MNQIDPKLIAHGASFWDWSDDELPHASQSNISDSDSQCDDDTSSTCSLDSIHSSDHDHQLVPADPSCSASNNNNLLHGHPQVIVFQGDNTSSSSHPSKVASIYEYKSFMSSKVSKVTALPTGAKPMTQKEQQIEAELNNQDNELQDLLATSRLIEDYALQELTGRDRRKYQLYKLEKLGMSPVQQKLPFREYLRLDQRDKKNEARALTKVKQLGLGKVVSNKLTTATQLVRNCNDKKQSSYDRVIQFSEFGVTNPGSSKKRTGSSGVGNRRERGLKATNLGTFKRGMLYLTKQDISKVQKSAQAARHKGKLFKK